MTGASLFNVGLTAIAAGGGTGAGFFVLKWLIEWLTGRFDKRQAQLDAEHAALDMSWKDYRLMLERRMASLERANEALRTSFQHVSSALIRIDPDNHALVIAERIMAVAFPADLTLATAMAGAALDEDERKRRGG